MNQSELAEFVAHEYLLLDQARYADWLALFSPDGHYWLPCSAEQTDPGEPSLAYEDRLMLSIRIERLSHPQAHSQHPPSRSLHVLQASRLVSSDQADQPHWVLRTPFIYFEQRGEQQIQLPGTATHYLTKIDGTLHIRQKRVDLLAAASALPMIQLFP